MIRRQIIRVVFTMVRFSVPVKGRPARKPTYKAWVLSMTAALLTASILHLSAQAGDPAIGTWKLNVAKSTYSPGPAPKSLTNKIEPWEGGRKVTGDGVDAQGKPTHTEISYKFDGKDYLLKGATPKQTRAYKRIDERTWEFVLKVDGKATTTTKIVVSRDGKAQTTTTTGKNAQGQTVNNVAVYDKQ